MIGILGGTGKQGSALARRYASLGEQVLVGTRVMNDISRPLDAYVPVCSSDDSTPTTVREWVSRSGARAIDAGPLSCAVAIEAITAVVLRLSKQQGSPISLRFETSS